MSNLELWRRVCKTDPRAVKPITGKQYQGNSPKPYWIVERLTEEFGPCGIGWGFTILNERIERFSDTDTLHVAVVEFWYRLGESRGVLQQIGQTKASYMSSKGAFILDEDAPKKSVTDALVKCASYIGFAGDIFSGRWDDSKYVAETRREYEEKDDLAAKLQASIDAEKAKKAQKRRDELDSLALDMIGWHKEGKDGLAIAAWYDEGSWDKEHAEANEERLYVWGQLRTESKLRAVIKSNRPAEVANV